MIEPIDWLYEYFSAKGEIPGETKEEQFAADYFDADLIDSFGVIELVSEIELKFDIEFKPEQMQDERFRTISGLAQIINENRKLRRV